MNENLFLKQSTITNTSDDSYSFPWIPENAQRRKSRLGTHKKQAELLPNLDSNNLINVSCEESKPFVSKNVYFISNESSSVKNNDLNEIGFQSKNNFQSNRLSCENVISDELHSLNISSPIEEIAWQTDLKPVDYSPFLNEITPMKNFKSPYTSAEDFVTVDEYKSHHHIVPVEKLHTSAGEFVPANESKPIEYDDILSQNRTSNDKFEILNRNINFVERKQLSLNRNTFPENFINSYEGDFINHCSISERDKITNQKIEPIKHQASSEVISGINNVHKLPNCENAHTNFLESYNQLTSPKKVIVENELKSNNINKIEFIDKNRVASKPAVHFAELPQPNSEKLPNDKNNSKIPSQINVKGQSYKVLNVLGKGGSSIVYQVLHPVTNESLAVKRVKLTFTDESVAQGYLDEVKMLESLQNCDVIIKMFDHELVCENNKKLLYVVLEKGDTDLSELIRNVSKAKKLSIPMIVYYWSEMLSAVKEIHSRGIIHSDLKPANFLLVRGRLKLIDFGIASSVQGDMTSVYKDVFTGTLNYMSPEAVNYVQCPTGPNAGYRITFKTDVWSLGCILYNLIYGKLPFQHINKRMEKMCAIVNPNEAIQFPEISDVPFVLMDSLQSCLIKDAKKRPTVNQLLDRILKVYTTNNI